MLFHCILPSGTTSHDIWLNITVLSIHHLMQILLLRGLGIFLRNHISRRNSISIAIMLHSLKK